MRYVLIILAFVLLFKTHSFAQDSTAVQREDSIRIVKIWSKKLPLTDQFMLCAGSLVLPYYGVNLELNMSRFGGTEEFTPQFAGGTWYIGFEGQSIFTQWRTIFDINYQTTSITREGRSTPIPQFKRQVNAELSHIGISLGSGYNLFKNSFLYGYPYLMGRAQRNVLDIEEEGIAGGTRPFDDSSTIRNSLTSIVYSGEVGLGADLNVNSLLQEERELFPLNLVIGLRAGYVMELLEFGDFGDNAAGLRLSIGVGISLQDKIFKAKIISEEK
ncbi:MAG: hypothetical protein V4642_15260 [Bacteroidota bacterium]